jgi:Ras-related protein Rab-2A
VEFFARKLVLPRALPNGNPLRIKFQFWDTAGDARFRSIIRSYFRGSCAFVLIYDVTRRETFESLPEWLDEVGRMGRPPLVVVVGTKADQVARRAVSTEEGEAFAKEHSAAFLL